MPDETPRRLRDKLIGEMVKHDIDDLLAISATGIIANDRQRKAAMGACDVALIIAGHMDPTIWTRMRQVLEERRGN